MRGPLRELSPAENTSHSVPAPTGPPAGGGAKVATIDTGPAHFRVCSWSARLSRVRRDEGADRIPAPISRPSNATMDLPLVPTCVHEGLVSPQQEEAHRGRSRATRSRSEESRK